MHYYDSNELSKHIMHILQCKYILACVFKGNLLLSPVTDAMIPQDIVHAIAHTHLLKQ